MDLTQILSWLKLPQRILLAFAIVNAFILWGPKCFITGLGLEEFIADYRKWLGVSFLFFVCAVLPNAISKVSTSIKDKIKYLSFIKSGKKRLQNLTTEEKKTLKAFTENDTRTQVLDYAHGLTVELENEGIIYRASTLSHGLTRFSYNIQPWAWEYLNKNEHLLQL